MSRSHSPFLARVAVAALVAALLSSCSGGENAEPANDVAGYADELETTLTESFAVGFEEEDVERPAALNGMTINSGPYETVEVLDAWDEWTKRVSDGGHPEIEYLNGTVAVWNYAALFYDGDNMSAAVDVDQQTFEASTGAPRPHEEALENELAFAVECVDEVQLRTIGQNSWDEVMRSFAVENEAGDLRLVEVLQDAVADAQAVLSR